MRRMALPIAATIGTGCTMIAAALVGMTWHDSARLIAIAFTGGLVVAPFAIGAFVLTRRRSVATQVGVVACVAVAVAGAGVLTAGRAMFVSGHDEGLLMVVLVAGGTAGVVAALAFARRLGVANRALQEAAQRIGQGDLGELVSLERPATAEMTALAREFDAMSARLAAARAHEQALDASRRELVAWISHDLRTPIAGILAIAEALEDQVITDEATVTRYLATIRLEAQRLGALVNDLFELSLIDSCALHLDLEPVSIADLVSDAIAAAAPLADAKRVRLSGSVHDSSATVDADLGSVLRILANLLDNAVRHTAPDGEVLVDAKSDASHVYVSVHDDCGGIPPQDLARVFDVAFQGDTARTPTSDKRGGLGLAIAQGIARAHDGEIEVRNDGTGCQFMLRLPINETTRRSAQLKSSASSLGRDARRDISASRSR